MSTDLGNAGPSVSGADGKRPIRQGHVLIVDDMSTLRLMLTSQVKQMGLTTAMASNGREALEALRNGKFDVVLLDVQMPEMDGYAVLEAIKSDPQLRDIPVIMVSGLDDLQNVVRCIERGADDFLPKPFNPTLLRARVGACLDKKHLWDELADNYRRLQELEALRDSLTHMIIHDLRTPLTSLLTGLQTMEMLGDLEETQQEMLAISLTGGGILLDMINDLLDIAKMESGNILLERQGFAPDALIAEASRQVEVLVQSRNLTLNTALSDGLPVLSADSDKLRRTLVNLLGNAIKFTPAGGVVTLSARLDPQENAVVFAVRDTGEGIPQGAFEHIFEKFGQAEGRKEGRRMSTGLGLTFCKMVAEAHGGRIWVESEMGLGSLFQFTIPLH